MLLPGFGEAYVPARVRLLLAALFSAVLVPVLPAPPVVPSTVFGVTNIIIAEIMVGLFLGGLSRILISAVQIAGNIIALQSSLASALVQDVTQVQGQATALGNYLGMTALVLLFATDLHHVMLKGLADSYQVFSAGQFPIIEDMANHATTTMNSAFIAALQLSAPNIIIGVILYLGAGILSRLVPNIQVFFIMMSPQIMISLFVLMISLSAMMLFYIDYFKNAVSAFVAP